MKVHREGFSAITAVFILLLFINLLIFLLGNWPVAILTVMVVFSLVLLTGLALFFRIPNRKFQYKEGVVYAPADGTILHVNNAYEGEYFKKEMLKISIFMSIYNVHLNRVPFNGVVKYQKYHRGKHLVAFHPKSSEKNEHNTIVFTDADGNEILVRQIAGIVARRIRWYVSEGEKVSFADEMGFIKFGSRVDIFLPENFKTLVNIGDKVKSGLTEISVR